MPTPAEKRIEARQRARVARAHQAIGDQPVVRRAVTPRRGKAQPTGFTGFLQRFPVLTTLFVAAVVGLSVFFMFTQKIGPWAPKPHVVGCNLTTHVCDKPALTIDKTKLYTATIKTAKGDIVIALDAKDTPITVNNFVYLARQHYFDGTYFWRVEVPGQPSPIDPSGGPSPLALIQGGSVTDNGRDPTTMPGYAIADELGTASKGYQAGVIAMANAGANTGATQFFINTGDNTGKIGANYSAFGHVTSGLDVAGKISPKDKIISITITESVAPTATSTAPAPTATTK
jgi:cyclophilin family peptidyl-prolyl cis-trans isomerase